MADDNRNGAFELTDRLYFEALKVTLNQYVAAKKAGEPINTRDVVFMLIGVNHLREWISPGTIFDKHTSPTNDKERFGVDIYNNFKSFRRLNKAANRLKHVAVSESEAPLRVEYASNPDFFAADDFFDQADILKGKPVAHYLGDEPIENLIGEVLDYFEKHWFNVSR